MYEPYTWTTGEVITAEKLNHAEEGIEGAYDELSALEQRVEANSPLIVTQDENLILDKTWQNIHDALVAGRRCVLVTTDGEQHPIYSSYQSANRYIVSVYTFSMDATSSYVIDSASGCPEYEEDEEPGPT